jgi:hypothetical protein
MRAFRAAFYAAILPALMMLNPVSAFANGALAIGACGAYGFARGYANPAQAEAAIARQVQRQELQGRGNGAGDMHGVCGRALEPVRLVWLCDRSRARQGAEPRIARVSPQWRKGLRDPHLRLRLRFGRFLSN